VWPAFSTGGELVAARGLITGEAFSQSGLKAGHVALALSRLPGLHFAASSWSIAMDWIDAGAGPVCCAPLAAVWPASPILSPACFMDPLVPLQPQGPETGGGEEDGVGAEKPRPC